MKSAKVISFAIALAVCSVVFPGGASAEDVKMDGASFQEILDKLFGVPETEGLLAGDEHFSLHAKDVTLTEEQAELFFNPSEANTSDLADLIAAAEALKANLKIEGDFDSETFKLNLSGKQIKLEGLVLTQAQFDALIEELQGIESLKQAKVQATVDGKLLIAKLENQPGKVKIEDKGSRGGGPSLEASNRSGGRPDKPEKPERGERPEKPERIERIERGGGRR
jgi:hypothetical protein